MTTAYILHYAPDNASLIVRLALEELGVAYRTRLVDRAAREQEGAAYRALNPAGRIPTLETPWGPVSETGAVLLWLADRHGGLMPGVDDPARGTALNWLFFIANTLHADAIALFHTDRYGPAEAIAAMRAALRARIAGNLDLIEREARPRLGPWLGGSVPSALDLYLAGLLRWLQLYPQDEPARFTLDRWPGLARACAALEARPSVSALRAAEGLGDRPFTAPDHPVPHKGSAS